ncbi:MAG: hypothetical protein K2X66_11980 [Cyanobacteria bacterium]|nr:hypothetical protein [Cyanobacteriota bacterium]
MDTTLYQILKDQLPEPPDLSIIQQKHPMPEAWPVILKSVDLFRKKIQAFTVSDGTHSVFCQSVLPEVYDKIASLELGTIIHLVGSETVFDNESKRYVLDIHSVLTLKEYDDHLKEQARQESERLARLREQDYRDQDYFESQNQGIQSSW